MRYLSKKRAAQELDVSIRTIDRWIKLGKLRPVINKINGRKRIPRTQIKQLFK